jgi:hypothetical protein
MSLNEDLTGSGRPTKRAKLTTDYQEDGLQSEDEGATQPAGEVRASDLYLDTVSEPSSVLAYLCSLSSRLIGQFLILTSRRSAQCHFRISIYTGVLFAGNISKEEVVNRMLTPIRFTRITTFSLILRLPR